jgi:segregation and condensation protein B
MSVALSSINHGPDPDVQAQALRIVEAVLFAAAVPLSRDELARQCPAAADVGSLLSQLQETYAERGVNLVQVAGKWAFRADCHVRRSRRWRSSPITSR